MVVSERERCPPVGIMVPEADGCPFEHRASVGPRKT
jgi:hypothetical protein